jgi:hypothetical protein
VLSRGDTVRAPARQHVRETFFHDPGNATANALRELYALMELDMPAGPAETQPAGGQT